ncbi:MAG: hypothetical protein MUF31_17155 [Akkermansiaceae bacterium]|jgi:hypothetical protein|nr:hypothetical protein [Akkermansiaceae bacterium]
MKTLDVLCALLITFFQFAGPVFGGMHADKEVEDLYLRMTSKLISVEDNLSIQSEKNSITLKDRKWIGLGSILRELEIAEFDSLEGVSGNGWGIERYRVSKSYDLIIEFEVLEPLGEGVVRIKSLFVAPHQARKYGAKLFNKRRWSEIQLK